MMRRTLAVLGLAALAATAQQPTPRSYVLGPEDQLTIRVLDAQEFDDKPVRIDFSGYLRLPMIGRIQAGGLTLDQLEAELVKGLRKFIKEPQVTVGILEYRSQPVSVLGAVKLPGVHQVAGRKTLLEMISMAGGIDNEAGPSIKIVRRKEYGTIPLKSAAPDETGDYMVGSVDLSSILEARNPQENIEVKPYDVITIPRGDMVYVMGQVKRPGGFVLRQRETLSALQALALAEGLGQAASPQNARILRAPKADQQRSEIFVDMRKILQGKSSDVPLQPNDVLFIPDSVPKSAMIRAMEAAIQVGTGLAIYRR